jgi:hypothetical protein
MGYTLIQTQTASGDSELDFTIDDTYDEILFTITGFKSNTDERSCIWQVITSNGTYNRPSQSTAWRPWVYHSDYSHGSDYVSYYDKAIDDPDYIIGTVGGDTDRAFSAASGELRIYRPQDPDFYKYYQIDVTAHDADNYDWQQLVHCIKIGGYIKDTAAITGIRFASGETSGTISGTMAVGHFSMYGLS